MNDTIQSLAGKAPTGVPPWHAESKIDTSKPFNPTKEKQEIDAKKATSLYYMTTLSSLAEPLELSVEKQIEIPATESKIVEKSFMDRAKDWFWNTKDWLWNMVGLGSMEAISETEAVADIEKISETIDGPPAGNSAKSVDLSAGGIPQLERPDAEQKERLEKSIRNLRQELLKQKDITESLEEYNTNQLDNIIFLRLIDHSIKQKKLKESASIQDQEDLLFLHKKNDGLRKAHYELVDAILAQNKTREVLKWINVGFSIVTVGGTAIAFAVGGPLGLIGAALPLSMLGRGVNTIYDGILKFDNDNKTGELVPIKSESQSITSNKKEKMKHIQVTNEDIAELWKLIRGILDMQSKHERASFGANNN